MNEYRGVRVPVGFDRWPARQQQAWYDGVDRRLGGAK